MQAHWEKMRNHKRKKSVNRIPRSNKTSSLLLIEKASPETEKRGREREETAMVKSIFIKWSSINCTAHPSRRCLLLRLHRRRLCWDAHIFSYLFTFFWKKKNLFTRLEMYKMCVAMLDFFSLSLQFKMCCHCCCCWCFCNVCKMQKRERTKFLVN